MTTMIISSTWINLPPILRENPPNHTITSNIIITSNKLIFFHLLVYFQNKHTQQTNLIVVHLKVFLHELHILLENLINEKKYLLPCPFLYERVNSLQFYVAYL